MSGFYTSKIHRKPNYINKLQSVYIIHVLVSTDMMMVRKTELPKIKCVVKKKKKKKLTVKCQLHMLCGLTQSELW